MYYKLFLVNIFAVSILFISCSKDNADIISGGNYRYWLRNINDDLYNHKVYYYFDVDGRWTMFDYYGDKFRKVKYYDDVPHEYWSINNDSILKINNSEYLIHSITDTDIVLKKNGVYDTLIAVPLDNIPYKYRKRWNFSMPVDIIGNLYKTKIDSLYSENIKFIYSVLLERHVIIPNDSLNFYIADKAERYNNRSVEKRVNTIPVILKDSISTKYDTFVIIPPKKSFGQILFTIIVPKKIKTFNKNTIEVYYDYELDEYYMDTMNMSWIRKYNNWY